MSLLLNREPSAATPITVPTSRAVVVAEAAIPECLAGRADSATEVIGTTAIPNPIPARSSENTMGRYVTLPLRERSVKSTPAPAQKQPTVTGMRGPESATHLPATVEATIIPTAMGTKSAAVW